MLKMVHMLNDAKQYIVCKGISETMASTGSDINLWSNAGPQMLSENHKGC